MNEKGSASARSAAYIPNWNLEFPIEAYHRESLGRPRVFHEGVEVDDTPVVDKCRVVVHDERVLALVFAVVHVQYTGHQQGPARGLQHGRDR